MSAEEWLRASDAELLEICRRGDTGAFAPLWDRHRRAAFAAARGIAPTLDADDLVSEAYLRIFELTIKGGGPRGAFRPYLYRVIRSVAVDRLRSPEQPSDELDQIPDLHEAGPWEDSAFDLNAVSKAFSTLNDRWQAALWYTEVEGMPPREAALLLGISANSVSALALRAREALKSAWVEAHVNQQLAEAACHTTRRDLQRYQRGKLTARATREVEAHLAECETCAGVAAEFSTLNRQLGLALAAVFLGGAGAAALLNELGIGLSAQGAAAAAAAPGQGGGAGGAGAAGGSARGAAAAGGGIGTVVAVVSGVAVAAAAVLGGAALVISNLVLPVEADTPPPAPTEHVDRAPVQDSADDSESEDPPTEADSDEVRDELTVSSGSTVETPRQSRNPQPPPKPTPPPVTPPNPPNPPGDGSDPALAVFDVCRSPFYPPEYFILGGNAVESGVVRARITQGTTVAAIPVDFDEFSAPVNPGDPWQWSSIHQSILLISLTPLSQWGLVDEDISNVTVELRFITPDGRYSPWTPIDTSIDC